MAVLMVELMELSWAESKAAPWEGQWVDGTAAMSGGKKVDYLDATTAVHWAEMTVILKVERMARYWVDY